MNLSFQDPCVPLPDYFPKHHLDVCWCSNRQMAILTAFLLGLGIIKQVFKGRSLEIQRRFHSCLVLFFHPTVLQSIIFSLFRGQPWPAWDSMRILTDLSCEVWSITALACQSGFLMMQRVGFGSAISCEKWDQGSPSFWVFDVIDFQCGLWASRLTSLAQLTIWKMNMMISHKGIVRLLNV